VPSSRRNAVVRCGDALALRDVGANVLIVVAGGGDLVATGLVDSLARPRSNVTGLQVLQTDLAPKRLQILKELIPRLQRVALLHETPGSPAGDPFYAQLLATLEPTTRSRTGTGISLRRCRERPGAASARGRAVLSFLRQAEVAQLLEKGVVRVRRRNGPVPQGKHSRFASAVLRYRPKTSSIASLLT
jgi:hypothetical protein